MQISDLHNARFGNEQSRLLQAVAEQEPDSNPVAGSKNVKEKYSISAVFLFLLKNGYTFENGCFRTERYFAGIEIHKEVVLFIKI